ncbi:MAG: secretin N-terminal domain-containing protein [Chthoniobacterales bacterium]
MLSRLLVATLWITLIGSIHGQDVAAGQEEPAQDQTVQGAPVEEPGDAPAPMVAIATPPPTAPALPPRNPISSDNMVTLQYPNSDVVDVLRLYETLTGKKLIMDNFVQGKVNIFINKPVPREEAIKIIEINLLLNGFSLVPAEGDIVKVIGPSKNPRNSGVPIISEESEIPPGEHVISFLFKLRYADPTELQQVLGQYLSPPQPYTSFLALPKSSSILVTENSSVIRSLVKIIDQIDIPPAEVVSEFIRLERADASKVVEMLKDVFEKGTQSSGPGGVPGAPAIRPVRGGVPVPQPAQVDGDIGGFTGLSEESVVVGKIKLSADVRTNRIHVITRPINMPFVRKLIAQFDANVEFAKPVTRALRYISAADVLPVLVQALTEPGTNQPGGAEGGANGGAAGQQPARKNSTSATSPGGFSSGSSSDSTSSAGGSINISEELSTEAVDTTPKAVTIGNSKIIADQRANTIIVLGNREVVVKVMKILDEMDVKAPQVALSTVIGELTLSKDEEFGVDYLLRFQRQNGGNGGFAGTSRNTGIPAAGIVDPGKLINFTKLAAAATSGTNVYLAAGDTLTAIVHALDSTGNFKTISRPTVFTSNNKKAIIASGTEIPVPVNTISSATGSGIINTGLAQQTNIQFKKVALQLEVVPLINSEKEVSLDILQKLDSIGTFTRVDNNLIPNINTRYIRTNVSAPNCSTIVLGGLIQDRKRRDQSGIPILDRLPIIGGLFRDTIKSGERTELIVLMRPEVTLTKLDMYRLRNKTEERTHFGPEIDQDDCPDCPPRVGRETIRSGDDKQLPAPDLPPVR